MSAPTTARIVELCNHCRSALVCRRNLQCIHLRLKSDDPVAASQQGCRLPAAWSVSALALPEKAVGRRGSCPPAFHQSERS